MTEIKNGELQKVAKGLLALKGQEFYTIPAHRVKVAVKAVDPIATALQESTLEVVKKFGTEVGDGKYTFEDGKLALWNDAMESLMDESVELPSFKGITWNDIAAANAKISATDAEALEGCGFLTGNPDPDEPKV